MFTKSYFKKRAVCGFDKWAQNYSEIAKSKIERRGYSYEILAKKILRLNSNNNCNMIEIGTGTGILGKEIKKISKKINLYGADISLNMLKECEKSNIYNFLVRSDASELPFRESSFDMLYSTFMLHSSYSISETLKEFERITKNGSVIVIADLMIKNNQHNFISKIKQLFHSIIHEKGALSHYVSPTQFEMLLDKTNLDIISSEMLGEDIRYRHYIYYLKNNKDCNSDENYNIEFQCPKCHDQFDITIAKENKEYICEKCGEIINYIGGVLNAYHE